MGSVLGSLHWPVGGADLGDGGGSYVEMLILYELWVGERLTIEKAHPRYLRPRRPISVPAVPFGPGIDIWRSCRFIGALMRSLCLLPGGLGHFVPCSIGCNHCRLRHIGWDKCCHGLPRRLSWMSCHSFFSTLLGLPMRCLLVHFPSGTAPHRFASKVPTWRLPVSGHAASLVTAELGVVNGGGVEVGDGEVHWSLLGGCLCLVRLLVWSLLVLGWLVHC